MTDIRRPGILIATVALVLAACGGGGGGTKTEAPGSPTPASGAPASDAPATDAPATDAPATDAPGPTESPGGGGTAVGACELVTAAELQTIFSVPSVTTQFLAGPPDTCIVESGAGDPLISWSVSSWANARGTFDGFALPGRSVAVTGIGDAAAFVVNIGLLVVKGHTLLHIPASVMGDLTQEQENELAKKVGAAAVARM